MNNNESVKLISKKTKAIRSKSEPYLLAIAFIAVVLKTQHISSSGFIVVVSLSLLSLSSFLSAFDETENSENNKLLRFINYLKGWGMSILYIGILFSIQNWPGNKSMLISGLSVTALTVFLEFYNKTPSNKLLIRIIILFIGLSFLLLTQQQLFDLGIIHKVVNLPEIR